MLDAAMRVAPYSSQAEDFTLRYDQMATPWPFSVAPEEIQLWQDSPTEPGTGYLVTDPVVLEALRAERDNAAQRGGGTLLWFGPYEERYYSLGVREVLPIENEQGLIARPEHVTALGLP